MVERKDINRVVVTGGAGFLGRHIVSRLKDMGIKDVLVPRSRDCDLRSMKHCLKVTEGQDVVIHAAAHVGGIGHNRKKPAELFYDNAVMGIQLIEAARRNHVKKIVVIGAVCGYPRNISTPFNEKDLWNGYPEVTNGAYGIAKRMLHTQLKAYRQQYGLNGIYLILSNLYGPGADHAISSSHVIPALIQKMKLAKQNKESCVTLWGDGSPKREFLYVDDAANMVVSAMLKYNESEPLNIGSGQIVSIRDLAHKIRTLVGYEGDIHWDSSKPNGHPHRQLSTLLAVEKIGLIASTPFEVGLQRTINSCLSLP